MRRKPCPLGTTTRTSHDVDYDREAGSSSMGRASAAMCSCRHLARSPTYHFKRLLEEACLDHAYPIRHKLKYCGMMQSFLTSGSLTWGTESNEGLDGSDAASLPKENVVMMVLGGHPWKGGTTCPA
jgi:hypothetical protein